MSKLLDIAISQIGVEEDKAHTNHGEAIKYQDAVGLPKGGGYAWCQSFVFWCGLQAYGNRNPVPKTAGVLAAWNAGKDKVTVDKIKGNLSLIQPGDQFIMDFKKDNTGHTGIIERIDPDGTLHTIEGNSNPAGGRDGYCVGRHARKVSDKFMKGFIRYRMAEDAAATPIAATETATAPGSVAKKLTSLLILAFFAMQLHAQTTIPEKITAYKTMVDDSISNRVGNKVITPSNVGQRIKSLADIVQRLYDSTKAAKTLDSILAVNDTVHNHSIKFTFPSTGYALKLYRQDYGGEVGYLGPGIMGFHSVDNNLSLSMNCSAASGGSNTAGFTYSYNNTYLYQLIFPPSLAGNRNDTLQDRTGVIALLGDRATPSISAGTGAGTGPTISISGDNHRGTINITTGTSCATGATIATITFATAYNRSANVVLTPANTITARLTAAAAFVDNPVTSSFVMSSNTTALTDATIYKWNYVVVQ